MSWETVPLDSVSEVIRGVTFAKADSSSTQIENSLPVLRAGNIQEQIILDDGLVYVSEDKIKDSQLLKMNDIVLCTSSGSSKLVGKSARLKNDWNGSFGAFCAGIRPNPQYVSPSFIFHFLQSPVFRRWTTSSDGVGIKNIRSSDLKAFPIPLPPLPEQRRIAAILDQADALRQKRQQALDHLNQLGQSIFYEMFGDKIRNEDPKSWPELKSLLSEKLRSGAYYPKEEYSETGIEMVHMSDAFYDLVYRGNLKRVICPPSDLEKYSLNQNDLLIARRSLVFEGAAKPCMIPRSEEPLIFESSFIRVRPDNTKVVTEYLFYYLNLEEIKERFVRPFVTRSTISGINQTNLGDIKIMLPSVDAQNVFCEKIQKLSQVKEQHTSLDSEFVSLFSSLQQRAFRGEL